MITGVAPILESYLSTPRSATLLARAIIASRSSAYDDAHQERYFACAIRVIYGAARSYHHADAREIPLFTRITPHSFSPENACKTYSRFDNHNMTTRTIYYAGKNDIPLTGRLSCRHYHYVRGAIRAGNVKSAIVAIGVLNQVFQECCCIDNDSPDHNAHHADICCDAGRHASTNIMRAILETICQHSRDEGERRTFVLTYIAGLCEKNNVDEYAALRQLSRTTGTPYDEYATLRQLFRMIGTPDNDYYVYSSALYGGSLDICELINLDHDAMIRAFGKAAAGVYYCNVRGIRYAMERSPEIAREITDELMNPRVRIGLLAADNDERFTLCWEHPANITFWRGLSSLDKSKYHRVANGEYDEMNPRMAMHIKQRWKDYCAKYS